MQHFKHLLLGIRILFIFLAMPIWANSHDSHSPESIRKNASIMMKAINEGDWDKAQTFAEQSDMDILRKIYSWFALRSGHGSIEECIDFLTQNSDWPGLSYLQMACENNLYGQTEDNILLLTDFHKAMSADAFVKRMQLLYKNGRKTEAQDEISHLNKTVKLQINHFQTLIQLDEKTFLPKALQTIRYEIFKENFAEATDFIQSLSKNLSPLMISQLHDYIDNMRIENIDEDKIDNQELFSGNYEGTYYKNAKLAYQSRNFIEAADAMLRAENSEFGLEFSIEWAELRADLARRLIETKQFSKAYKVASQHHLPNYNTEYSELEFLSGFIALEFLHNQSQARVHFENLKNATTSPISSGRAGFWLGQAGDPKGYEFAAQYQTSFYGQLSAEILGKGYDRKLIDTSYAEWRNQKFMAEDSIYAGIIFAAIGENLLAHRFLAHAAETMNPENANALGEMALEMQLPYSAVLIGKRVADKGLIAAQAYYPFPHYNIQQSQSPQALTLAIMRQESEFYPIAESPVGAAGLMQIMPKTGQHLANYLGVNFEENFLIDYPNFNILLGSTYLNELLSTHNGFLPFVAPAYNAGPHRVQQWRPSRESFENINDAIMWMEMIPFDETRNYVQRIIESVWIYDAKLQQEYTYNPSDLLLKPYPLTKDYQNARKEFYSLRKSLPRPNITRPVFRPD